MKKYKEWLTNEIEIMESETSENYPHEQMIEREVVLNLIDQLDEPEVKQLKRIIRELASFNDELIRDNNQLRNELDNQEVLSQEWISENSTNLPMSSPMTRWVPVSKLQNLLVPKQEELESAIKVLIEAYKQEENAHSELENGWISGFIKDLKNLLEEEQKYYVSERDEEYGGFWFLSKNDNGDISIGVGRDWSEVNWDRLKLTEQEIKDYDERYWAFAKKVEEMEE